MTSHLDDQQLSRLLDGDLSLAERAAALAHLSSCSACAQRQAELVEVAATLRSYPRIAWTSHHTTGVMAELRAGAHEARQRRAFPALLLTIAAAGLVLAALLAAPVGPQLASAVFDAVALMPPLRIASGGQALLTLLVVALVAPALVYPLARWR